MDLKAYYYYTISTYYEAEDSSRILLVSRVVRTSSFMVAQRLVSIPGDDKFFLPPGRTIRAYGPISVLNTMRTAVRKSAAVRTSSVRD